MHQVCLHVQKPDPGGAHSDFCEFVCQLPQERQSCQSIICLSMHREDVGQEIQNYWCTGSECWQYWLECADESAVESMWVVEWAEESIRYTLPLQSRPTLKTKGPAIQRATWSGSHQVYLRCCKRWKRSESKLYLHSVWNHSIDSKIYEGKWSDE